MYCILLALTMTMLIPLSPNYFYLILLALTTPLTSAYDDTNVTGAKISKPICTSS